MTKVNTKKTRKKNLDQKTRRRSDDYLNEFTREAIFHGSISGPPRSFKELTRAQKKIVKTAERSELANCRASSTAVLLWALIWGPASEQPLAEDDGVRTPAPTTPKEEVCFHIENLCKVSAAPGDVAGAVHYLRQHTDGSSPQATAHSMRKLLHKTNKAKAPLRLVSNNESMRH